jgi:methylenetetrahydrofolate--tRNA-(uracil-5-)-methyltransferase
LIPGLENAEFYRLGRVHRNTYVDSPRVLDARLAVRHDPRVRLAGQITGLEGYVESVATGMLAGSFTAAALTNRTVEIPPADTMLGALLRFVAHYEGKDYRPTNANFGLLPPAENRRAKGRERSALQAERARASLARWIEESGFDEPWPVPNAADILTPTSGGAGGAGE